MGRDPSRKKPKRGPRSGGIELDDDFVELAVTIAEHKQDNNARGWFSIPWRDGWNAIDLLHEEWLDVFMKNSQNLPPNHLAAAGLLNRMAKKEEYDRAAELLRSHEGFHLDDQRDSLEWIPGATQMMRAALRCLMLKISWSDGGGWAYNEFLRQAYQHAGTPELVRKWRCIDAIGVGPALQNDANDRARRAFITAWDRGLYHAAYSIKPVR